MLRDRLLKTVLSEILRELDDKIDTATPPPATITQNPEPRGNLHMIATGNTAPLFFSPNEEKIIALLKEQGPLRQSVIIERLELEMNATTVRELLGNLIKRRVLMNGPDGYEVIA